MVKCLDSILIIISRPNGIIYEGMMKDNKMHGEGKETSNTGKVKKGQWAHGQHVKWL
jgi:hypothetical protein